ncbi:MAG TPA: maleylpyruvate isomerase N-terminal domain-containing protein, partial [Dehalococcoidia bacterium]|nr:maleylpyruvate isomerase N-terminal domain-containing protein [Dehalococcoidia bacterium]
SHVAGWHREMAGALERMGRGERPTPEGVDYSDADSWNAKFSSAAANTSPAAMLQELEASFQTFRSAAAALGEDRFEQGRTVDRIVHTTGVNHYLEHGEQIREWRKKI